MADAEPKLSEAKDRLTDPQPIPSLPYESLPYPQARDADHLNLLAVFHYIAGGLTLLFACIPIIHVVFGLLMLSGKFNGPPGQAPPPAIGWLFVIIGSVVICFGWSLGLLIIYSGSVHQGPAEMDVQRHHRGPHVPQHAARHHSGCVHADCIVARFGQAALWDGRAPAISLSRPAAILSPKTGTIVSLRWLPQFPHR